MMRSPIQELQVDHILAVPGGLQLLGVMISPTVTDEQDENPHDSNAVTTWALSVLIRDQDPKLGVVGHLDHRLAGYTYVADVVAPMIFLKGAEVDLQDGNEIRKFLERHATTVSHVLWDFAAAAVRSASGGAGGVPDLPFGTPEPYLDVDLET
ncbi:MAG: hypothetical protein ACTHXA_00655 [Gulosibacter sp.]|uniref:hypothetical protein n=1 Tax=Gulosibacter sp. TaxID=2817531 RepID=UPI003F90DC4D